MAEDLTKKSAPEGQKSPGEIERLKECEKQRDEYLAGWQRSRADFLNYKREEMERITELLKYGTEELILRVLPILDNFDAAEKSLSDKNDASFKGFLQIKKQLQDFLKNQGVEEIKTLGQKFDANFHEVVEPASADLPAGQAGASAGKEAGTIIEEVQKGYKINGRLLRPAKVRVIK